MSTDKTTKSLLKLRDKEPCIEFVRKELEKTSEKYARMFRTFSITSGINYSLVHVLGASTLSGECQFPEGTIRIARCALHLDRSNYFYVMSELVRDSKGDKGSYSAEHAKKRMKLIELTMEESLTKILNGEQVEKIDLHEVR